MAMASVEKGDSQVSSVAKASTHHYQQVRHRGDSCQLHLRRISPFLISGAVWWRYVSGGFQFLDGDADRETQDGNDFTLLHFRKHSVEDVEERRWKCWKRIIDERLVIPATDVKVYDDGELYTGRIEYREGAAKFVPFAVVGSSAGGGGMGSSVGGGSDAAFVGSSARGGGMGSSVGGGSCGGSDATFVGSSAGGGGMGSSVGGGSDATLVDVEGWCCQWVVAPVVAPMPLSWAVLLGVEGWGRQLVVALTLLLWKIQTGHISILPWTYPLNSKDRQQALPATYTS